MSDFRRSTICLFAAAAIFASLYVKSATAAEAIATETLPAEPETAEARARFDEGVSAAQARDFDTARAVFAMAFEQSPNRAALFAWAQAERLSGHCDAAEPLYRRFMRQPLDDSERQAAELALRRCEQTPKPPAPAPVVLAPPIVPDTKPAPPEKTHLSRVFLVFAGGAAVATLTGLTLHGLAASNRDDAPSAATYDGYRDRLDRADTQTHWGWASLGAGALFGAVAGWRYVSDNRRGSEETAAQPAIAAAPMLLDHAVGAFITGTLP